MPKDSAPPLPGFGEGEIVAHPSRLVRDAFDTYNDYARRNKWTVTSVLDEGRQRAIRRALPTYGGLDGWTKNLEKASRSEFLMGRVAPSAGHRQFKMHLDFLLQPASMRKLIDGVYNGENDTPASVDPGTNRIKPVALNWRMILDTYRPGGKFWPSMQGNRPEGPGPHLAPADMIEAWRQKHGVTGMGHNGPPVETREEKLAASIRSYRKIGQYDRANKIEEQLAALEKRPPVLVPDPSVASVGMPPKPAPEKAPAYGWDHPAARESFARGSKSKLSDVEYDEVPEV